MRYRMFGRRTGLRVSELALGCGMFGTKWGHGAEPAEARAIKGQQIASGKADLFDAPAVAVS